MPNQEFSIQFQMTRISDAVNDIYEYNNDISAVSSIYQDYPGRAAQDIINCHRSSLEQVGFGLGIKRDGIISILVLEPKQAHCFLMQVNGMKSEYQKTLGELANSIERSIYWLSSSVKGEDLHGWVRGLDDVVTRFEYMGLDDQVRGARKLVDAARAGFLDEQLQVDATGILKSSSGLTEWHKTNRPKALYDRWMMALDVLKEVMWSPTATPLANELINKYQIELSHFEKDIAAWKQQGVPHPDQRWEHYDGVARLVRGELEELLS